MPQQVVTSHAIAALVGKAWLASFTPLSIMSRKREIVPLTQVRLVTVCLLRQKLFVRIRVTMGVRLVSVKKN